MPFVYNSSGEGKPVKNLAWLLRHAASVEEITLSGPIGARRGGMLSAWLSDGRYFTASFASYDVMRNWVRRPSLRHARVNDDFDRSVRTLAGELMRPAA